MTQTQAAGVRADDKPSAIVVGVGAEQGLGAALCRRFAVQGYHVFAAGRTSGQIKRSRRPSPAQVAAPRRS